MEQPTSGGFPVSMTPDLIEKLAAWSEPKQVVTKHGDRILRTAPLTDELETFYQNNKLTLNQAGVVPSHFKGKKELCWWQELPQAVVAEKQERVAQSRAMDADFPVPTPQGLEFRGYQRAGVQFCLESFKRYGGALLADEMGTGKSIQTCGIINAEPKIQRALIVAPKSLCLNWHRELRRWLTRPLTLGIAESKYFPSSDIVIINYELCRKFQSALTFFWDLIVLDESHRIKNPKTQITKSIVGYRPSKQERAEGVEPSSGIPTKRKLALTGTPIQNRPMEIFTTLNWIDPVRWKSQFDFGRQYCGGWNHITGRWDFTRASNTDRLQSELRSSFMIRRLKADVLKELPPKVRQIIILPSDGLEGLLAEERKLEERWQEKIAALKAQRENPLSYDEAAEQLKGSEIQGQALKLAHQVGLAKVPLVTEHVREALEDGAKIVLFAHHLDVVAAYMKAFSDYRPVRIIGEDSPVARQTAVDTFQREERCRIIVAGIHAAKEGFTLTASAHVVFGEIDWVPGVMNQCEDRCHRIGQVNSVLVHHLLLEGSLDVSKVQALIRKQEIIEGALDRRGKDEKEVRGHVVPRGTSHRPLADRIRDQARTDTDGRQMLLV
jgi:SWI/SNF-related matrix-associated actin-dependent regulator of chromatin subfamily A-like protein 1